MAASDLKRTPFRPGRRGVSYLAFRRDRNGKTKLDGLVVVVFHSARQLLWWLAEATGVSLVSMRGRSTRIEGTCSDSPKLVFDSACFMFQFSGVVRFAQIM